MTEENQRRWALRRQRKMGRQWPTVTCILSILHTHHQFKGLTNKLLLVIGSRCSVIWKTVLRSRSIIGQVESTWDVHSVRLSFTRGTSATCICCRMLIKVWLVLCVTTESSGLTGRPWGSITSRSMPRPCLIRSLHLVMICHIANHHWGQLASYNVFLCRCFSYLIDCLILLLLWKTFWPVIYCFHVRNSVHCLHICTQGLNCYLAHLSYTVPHYYVCSCTLHILLTFFGWSATACWKI